MLILVFLSIFIIGALNCGSMTFLYYLDLLVFSYTLLLFIWGWMFESSIMQYKGMLNLKMMLIYSSTCKLKVMKYGHNFLINIIELQEGELILCVS